MSPEEFSLRRMIHELDSWCDTWQPGMIFTPDPRIDIRRIANTGRRDLEKPWQQIRPDSNPPEAA
jgi:hypothetical protein